MFVSISSKHFIAADLNCWFGNVSSSLVSENKETLMSFHISFSTASTLFLRELTFKCPSTTFFGFSNLCSWTCGYELPLLISLWEAVLFALKSIWVSGQQTIGLSILGIENSKF